MRTIIAVGLAFSLLSFGAASARPYPAGGVTAGEVADILSAQGLPAEVTTDDEGDPMVKSSSEKVNWRVYFYTCENGRCANIQFQAGFDLDDNTISYEKINTWNFTKRFGRGALDGEMDPYLRYDIDAEKGFTSEAMTLATETWLMMLPKFVAYIGYEP